MSEGVLDDTTPEGFDSVRAKGGLPTAAGMNAASTRTAKVVTRTTAFQFIVGDIDAASALGRTSCKSINWDGDEALITTLVELGYTVSKEVHPRFINEILNISW